MNPPPVPMQSWEWPTQPWSRLHIDYAGSFQGKMLLVVIDTPSKWIEVSIVNTATTAITFLRSMFATHGLAKTVVSDVFLIAVSLKLLYRRMEYVTSELPLTTQLQTD